MASGTTNIENGIQCRGINLADTILVCVPKLRFSSKYSDVLRSPQGLKSSGTPISKMANPTGQKVIYVKAG